MIIYTEHKNIDKAKWDACIKASDTNSIFVLSWYMDIVCPDWTALISDDYEAVFPLAPRSKYKINYLYQPYFTRYFGLYKMGKTSVTENDFFNAIPDKFKFVEFCLHEKNSFKNDSFKISERRYQWLDLNLSYEKIKSQYSENTRRNIKKAEKNNFVLSKGISGIEIVDLFKKTKGAELEIFDSKDYKVLINLMEECERRKSAESMAVYENDKLLAAAFFMIYGNRYVFLKSGVTEHGKNHGAMHFLIDSFLKEHAEQNKILDFGGSSVETVARFYKSFGAKDCLYLQVNKNKLPGLVNWIKSLKK
jgi:hypothetical protein